MWDLVRGRGTARRGRHLRSRQKRRGVPTPRFVCWWPLVVTGIIQARGRLPLWRHAGQMEAFLGSRLVRLYHGPAILGQSCIFREHIPEFRTRMKTSAWGWERGLMQAWRVGCAGRGGRG